MRYCLITLFLLSLLSCEESSQEKEIIVRQNICNEIIPETSASSLPFSGITKISNTAQTSITIHWKHMEGLKFYHIISYNNLGRKILKSVPAPQTSITLKNLIPDSEYKFLVRAIDESGFIDKNKNIIKIKTKPWPHYLNQKSTYFDTKQSINLGPSQNFIKEKTGTISLWIKPNFAKLEKDSRIITLHQGANAGESLSLALGPKRMHLIYTNKKGKVKKAKFEVNLDDNNWHHIGLVIQKGIIQTYLDEQEIIRLENFDLTFGSHAAHLGSYTANQKGFSGYIDEVLFLNVPLSADQISLLYQDKASSDPRALIRLAQLSSWYRMGDSIKDNQLNIEDITGDNNGTPLDMTSSNFIIVTP